MKKITKKITVALLLASSLSLVDCGGGGSSGGGSGPSPSSAAGAATPESYAVMCTDGSCYLQTLGWSLVNSTNGADTLSVEIAYKENSADSLHEIHTFSESIGGKTSGTLLTGDPSDDIAIGSSSRYFYAVVTTEATGKSATTETYLLEHVTSGLAAKK